MKPRSFGEVKTMTEEMLHDYVRKLVKEQESLTAKYMFATGLKVDEICLVERESETGRVFYPDLKSKYDKRPDIAAIKAELVETLFMGKTIPEIDKRILTVLKKHIGGE